MAYIINQLTEVPDVYMYIDEVAVDETTYSFKGWVCSTINEISSIHIGESSNITKFTQRPDVKAAYPLSKGNPGIEFTIDKSQIFEPLAIKYKNNKDVDRISSLAKWVSYYSGFNNEDKGLIVVDNFYKDPDLIRKWATSEVKFSPSNYHKGERATARFTINGTKEKLEEIIGKEIYNWNHNEYANGIFQFCTADQPIVYHVDNQTYAGIVFLSPEAPASTGTSFYRSKFTGDYRFDDEKRNTMSYVHAFKGNSAEMNFYDGTNFEKIDEVGNVYNRLVLFDAKNIHAATQYFGDAIDNSRFFHMFFFDV